MNWDTPTDEYVRQLLAEAGKELTPDEVRLLKQQMTKKVRNFFRAYHISDELLWHYITQICGEDWMAQQNK